MSESESKKDAGCRVCLGKVKKRDKCIDDEVNNLPILQHIMSIAEVKIMVNDGLPQKVCLQCLTNLETAIRFKRKCEESNKVLQESLTHTSYPVTPKTACKSEESQIVDAPKVKKEPKKGLENEEILHDPQVSGSINSAFSDDEISIKYEYTDDIMNENYQYIDTTNEANFEELEHFYDDVEELPMNLAKEDERSLPQCDDCKEYFYSKMKLQVHWKKIHLPALLTCLSCQRTFKKFRALHSHQKKQPKICSAAANFLIQVSGKNKTWICKLCGVKCEHTQILYHYITTHTDKKWHSLWHNKHNKVPKLPKKRDENSYKIDLHLQCDDCKAYFRTKAKLQVHWKRVHLPECDISCKLCKKQYTTYKQLRKHEKMKLKSCIEASTYKIERVGKVRWFLCNHCDHKSKKLSEIRIHNYTHTGEKPYVCNICGVALSQIASLISHKESAHKMYKKITTCQYCGKLLKGYNSIRRHLTTHDASFQVQCDFCKKYFKSKQSLKLHLFRHAGEKTFKCELCHKMFFTRVECHNHFKNVHKNKKRREKKRFNCAKCSYRSPHPEVVQKHEDKHEHNDFYCPLCGKFFSKSSRLAHHNTIITDCPYCGKKFCYKDMLEKHIKFHQRTDASTHNI